MMDGFEALAREQVERITTRLRLEADAAALYGCRLEDTPFGPEQRDKDGFYHLNIAESLMPKHKYVKKGKKGKKGGMKKGGKRGY